MSDGFFNILVERMMANGFTAGRLEDATAHVIDNFQYRELNVSDIIKFDRRVKLYTGKEFIKAQINGIACDRFERREIAGTVFWVLKEDLIKAGLR